MVINNYIGSIIKRNRSSKAAAVAASLGGRIRSGSYRDGFPSIKDLSKEFKVNKNTADKALRILAGNGEIIRIPGKGSYVCGSNENILRKKIRVKTRRYAFLIDRKEQFQGYLQLLDVCDAMIAGIGGTTVFVQFDSDTPEEKILGRLRNQQIEGVFVCGLLGEKLLSSLKNEFHVLVLDYNPGTDIANSIVWNNFESGRLLAEKLVGMGCREFTCVQARIQMSGRYSISPNHIERMHGVRSLLEEKGIEMDVINTEWELPEQDLQNIRRSLEKVKTGKRALVTACLQLCMEAVARTNTFHLLSDGLRFGTFVLRSEKGILPRGAYAMLDIEKMGKVASDMLLDVLGRPPERFRSEVINSDIFEIR